MNEQKINSIIKKKIRKGKNKEDKNFILVTTNKH